jgi:hypothetical protein
MVPTSDEYRKLAYSIAPYDKIMRQFLPYALIKIIDVSARDTCTYSATSEAFYSNFKQLIDDVMQHSNAWGTLEDYQFLLDGNVLVMPDDPSQMELSQNGWVVEELSSADGQESAEIKLYCKYPNPITTVGRVLAFDPSYDSYPVDVDLVYTRVGVEVARDEIRNNTNYTITSSVRATRYDQIMVQIHKTSKPYRRVHLLEDIPGVYIEFKGTDIVSLSLNQAVDLYSEEAVTGEADLIVRNTNKFLDILNGEGLNAYLQRHQPIDLYLNLIYPDLHEEPVHLGFWELSKWKADNTNLEASFTILDPLNKLSRASYIKGTFPDSPRSLYSMAEEVLADAKIENYRIAEELKSVMSSAALPIATHKECLRLIAQAGRCVLVAATDGAIELRNTSPLLRGTNLIQNAGFDEGAGNWTLSNCTSTTDFINTGLNAILVGAGTASLKQTLSVTSGHKYYGRFYALAHQDLWSLTGTAQLFLNGTAATPNLREANLTPDVWTAVTYQWVANSNSLELDLRSSLSAAALYVDSFMLIDLTALYGVGQEPPQDWCDANLRFTQDSLLFPPHRAGSPDDTLDYSLLFDPPDITLKDPVSSVKVSVYDYVEAADESELYNATRVVRGTETFEVQFNGMCRSCKVTATLEGEGTAPTIVLQEVYAQAARLTVRANGTVRIVVTGKSVSNAFSTFDINFDVASALQEDAKEHAVTNSLITSREVAEDVAAYVAFWDSCRNEYDFSWRQNPAIELLDLLEVHDDFDNNNVIWHTERDLDYTDGALSGDSKGVC